MRKPLVTHLRIVVEGLIDEAIARRVAEIAGYSVGDVFIKEGKQQVDPRLSAYAAAARFGPWLVLRDLDHDADCAPTLLHRLLPQRPPNLLLRIPVRSVESWILADSSNLAAYLGISSSLVPDRPDDLDAPKRFLVQLARRSRHRMLRRDMTPPDGSRAMVGPGYTGRVIQFVTELWSCEQAVQRSPSLRRCVASLISLRERPFPPS